MLMIIIGTGKLFQVTNMCKLVYHRKCTVAAAYNMSVVSVHELIAKKFDNGKF